MLILQAARYLSRNGAVPALHLWPRGPAVAPSAGTTVGHHSDARVSCCVFTASGSIGISMEAVLECDLGHCVWL